MNESSLNNNVVESIKKMGRSPIFIVIMAAAIVSALLSLWTVIAKVIDYVGGNSYYYSGSFFAGELFTYIIGFVFTGLLALGTVLFYVACVSKKTPVSTTGLTIIKTIKIISLVLGIIGCVLLFLIAILVMVIPNLIGIDNIVDAMYQYSGTDLYNLDLSGTYMDLTAVFNVILVFAMVIIVITCVLMTIYNVKFLKTIKSVKLALTTGQPNNKASVFIYVMNFIGAFFILFGIGGNIITYLTGGMVLSMFLTSTISMCTAFVSLLFIGIAIIIYRTKMNSFLNGIDPILNTQQISQPVNQPTIQPTNQTTSSVFCHKCGAKIEGGSAFCTSCGQKIE